VSRKVAERWCQSSWLGRVVFVVVVFVLLCFCASMGMGSGILLDSQHKASVEFLSSHGKSGQRWPGQIDQTNKQAFLKFRR